MIIAFTNQKGGVAKTSSVLNIASALSSEGLSVLTVDLDAQSSLSEAVGIDLLSLDGNTIYEAIKGECDINETIQTTALGFDVIPAPIYMANADVQLAGVIIGRESLLKNSLNDLKQNYDVILLDCPPNLSIITYNALVCADKVYIPTLAELMCIKGVNLLLGTIKEVKKVNNVLTVGGVIITAYESNRNATQKCVEILEDQFKETLFTTKIRRNITISESAFFNKCVISHDKNSNGAKDYLSLTQEIIKREGLK